MYYFIILLRTIAVAFITNSHFKGVYPFDFMAFGGGIGVAIFFMISGFLLSEIRPEISFVGWYCKKIIRMYVPFLIFSFFRLFLGILGIKVCGINKTLGDGNIIIITGIQILYKMKIQEYMDIVFPLDYWFVYVIAILYALYFFYIKYIVRRYAEKADAEKAYKKTLQITGIILVVIFVAWYFLLDKTVGEVLRNPYFIMWIVWFICMLIGYWIRKSEIAHSKRKAILWIFGMLFFIALYLFTKVFIGKNELMNLQILLPISYVGCAYCSFRFFMNNEIMCKKIIDSKLINGLFGKVISMVSTASLEVYYVQFIWIKLLKDIVFPVNWLVIVIAIIVNAYILNRLSEYIIKLVSSRSKY